MVNIYKRPRKALFQGYERLHEVYIIGSTKGKYYYIYKEKLPELKEIKQDINNMAQFKNKKYFYKYSKRIKNNVDKLINNKFDFLVKNKKKIDKEKSKLIRYNWKEVVADKL